MNHAAPEMLEALESIVSSFNNGDDILNSIRKGQKALDKARGES